MGLALVAACLMLAAAGALAAPAGAKLSPLRSAVVRGEDSAQQCIDYNDDADDVIACAQDAEAPDPGKKPDPAFDAGLWQAVADHLAQWPKTPTDKAALARAAANALEARGELGLSEAALRQAMLRTRATDQLEDHAD